MENVKPNNRKRRRSQIGKEAKVKDAKGNDVECVVLMLRKNT